MTDVNKPARRRKANGPFSDELIDQLMSQVSGQYAESGRPEPACSAYLGNEV
jgi:hypothetical protein